MEVPQDLEKIMARVQEKRQSFLEYDFGPLENDAIKTFFDLAQEYETLDNFYRVTVSVPKEFFALDSPISPGPGRFLAVGLRQCPGTLSGQTQRSATYLAKQPGLRGR